MPFDQNSAKKAGKKSKRGPAKKEEPSIKEKKGAQTNSLTMLLIGQVMIYGMQ